MQKKVEKILIHKSLLELHEVAEQYASEKDSSHSFDANLEELFTFYFECPEEEEHKIMQIKTFIGIVTLVKIIEEKFLGARWLIGKGNIMEKGETFLKGLEENWQEFKKQHFVNPPEGVDNLAIMKELLDKIFSKFVDISSTIDIEKEG
jgi:hypothetical protein